MNFARPTVQPDKLLRYAAQFTADAKHYVVCKVKTRSIALLSAATLAIYPMSAQAQQVPVWVVVGVLSPLLAFLLCVILGLLAKSIRIGGQHAIIMLFWIVLFSLASYYVENDYLIWTPLVLYILHSILLVILIVLRIIKRVTRNE